MWILNPEWCSGFRMRYCFSSQDTDTFEEHLRSIQIRIPQQWSTIISRSIYFRWIPWQSHGLRDFQFWYQSAQCLFHLTSFSASYSGQWSWSWQGNIAPLSQLQLHQNTDQSGCKRIHSPIIRLVKESDTRMRSKMTGMTVKMIRFNNWLIILALLRAPATVPGFWLRWKPRDKECTCFNTRFESVRYEYCNH